MLLVLSKSSKMLKDLLLAACQFWCVLFKYGMYCICVFILLRYSTANAFNVSSLTTCKLTTNHYKKLNIYFGKNRYTGENKDVVEAGLL